MDVSFEEKSVWVQMISMVALLGGYFFVAGKMLSAGVMELVAYAPVFAVTVVLMVVVLVLGHVLAAVTGRREERDERDRLICWRAEGRSSWLLGVGVLAAISAMVFQVQDVYVAHLLLLSLTLSELLRFAFQIHDYRRGF